MDNNQEKNFSFSRDVMDNGYNGILTVRGDTVEDFVKHLDEMDDLMEKREMTVRAPYNAKQGGSAQQTVIAGDTKMCPIHNVTMDGRDGKYGKFYSHKLDDGSWCNGKPKGERSY